MSQTKTEARNKVAAKTRRIVERQAPLELEEFLAQGRRRSRQLRATSGEIPVLPFGGLEPAGASA